MEEPDHAWTSDLPCDGETARSAPEDGIEIVTGEVEEVAELDRQWSARHIAASEQRKMPALDCSLLI